MGGKGSGLRRRDEDTAKETHEFVREALRHAERAAPRIMKLMIARADKGEIVAQREVLDRGLGKATQRVDVSGTVAHLVLTPEQYALLSEAVDVEWKQIA